MPDGSKDQIILSRMFPRKKPSWCRYDQHGNVLELSLRNFQLTSLPAEITLLTHIRELDLSYNYLTQLPAELGLLTNLQKLDIEQNQLTHLPAELGQLTSLQRLELTHNLLRHLPAEIGQLTSLEWLHLNFNQLRHLPAELGRLANLLFLDLSHNQLVDVPIELGQLSSLQALFLNDNHLTHLPDSFGRLIHLQSLDAPDNHLEYLPAELGQLANLQRLTLYSNQLRQLPPELGQLNNLRELDLHNNCLTTFSTEPGQFLNLSYLSLSGNKLSQFSTTAEQFTSLADLDLSYNPFIRFPTELRLIASLQRLSLHHNQFTRLPVEIGQFDQLQYISLSHNLLTDLPSEMGQLTNLRDLDLSHNQLVHLPSELGQLTNLRDLYIGQNRLTHLPTELGLLTDLYTIKSHDNPDLVIPPPELTVYESSSGSAFLQELHEDKIMRYESKLLLVGESGAGKSSLLKALHAEPFEPRLSSTHGIAINTWQWTHPEDPGSEVILHTWDCSGQEKYRVMQQVFFTRRSLYLVVWNAHLGVENGRVDFWLETIKALAGDAPVILVATHADEGISELNYPWYKERYPQIVGSFSINSQKKEGPDFAELKAFLMQQAIKLPLMGLPLPGKWIETEKALLKRQESYINAHTYLGLCSRKKVIKKIASNTLGRYLHDLGKILYFCDDELLADLIILKPDWIAQAMSCMLEDESIKAAGGILTYPELSRIWAQDQEGKPYDPSLYPLLLRLLERFGLHYQLAKIS